MNSLKNYKEESNIYFKNKNEFYVIIFNIPINLI